MNSMLGLIFAYRAYPELRELAQPRIAASLPFGGRYRAIDFCLSNMVNAGVTDVGVIMRDSYQSLMDHLGSGKDWDLSRKNGGLFLLPPYSYGGPRAKNTGAPFGGKLDALAGIVSYIEHSREEYVVMADGDCITNIDLSEVLAAHIDNDADITAVCTRKFCGMPEYSLYFGIGNDGCICRVDSGMANPGANESLGIFILKRQLLLDLIKRGQAADEVHFERGVLRASLQSLRVMPFYHNGYIARNQNVAAYFSNTMKLLQPEIRADLFNAKNPVRTRIRDDAPAFYSDDAVVTNSMITEGCRIEGKVENSILFRNVYVAPGAVVRNSIILQGGSIGAGAEIDCVIADKHVTLRENIKLRGDREYPVVIAKNAKI